MIQRDEVEEMVNGLQWDAVRDELQFDPLVQEATAAVMTPRAWEELSQKLSKVFE
jgi:hypothetical protein